MFIIIILKWKIRQYVGVLRVLATLELQWRDIKGIISAVRLSPQHPCALRCPSKSLPLWWAASWSGAAAGSGRPPNMKRSARAVSWGLHLPVSGTASLLSGEGGRTWSTARLAVLRKHSEPQTASCLVFNYFHNMTSAAHEPYCYLIMTTPFNLVGLLLHFFLVTDLIELF